MLWSEFERLDRDAVAQLVRARGDLVSVFWVNGTRRWFEIERRRNPVEGSFESVAGHYVELVANRAADIIDLFYSHGIHTLIVPAVTAPNLLRGDGYVTEYLLGLAEILAEAAPIRAALERWGVRVHSYGEMAEMLSAEHRERYLAATERMAHATAGNERGRLFIGACAADSANAAVLSLERLGGLPAGRPLTRRDLVEAYYGDWIERVHLAIAHGRLSAHGTPFMMAGEDMYFMVAPSLDLEESTLRRILYDYLFSRRIDDLDYDALTDDDWRSLGEFYRRNSAQVVGVGKQGMNGKVWTIAGDFDAEVGE